MDAKQIVENGLIYKCLAGSHAYGTAIEGVSDIDYRGVFIAPKELIISCSLGIEQTIDNVRDEQLYELKKFLTLAMENNPNIIELLYMPTDKILFCHPYFQRVLDNKHLFLSKKAMHTFSGYAFAQLKRIRGHKRWISNPRPIEPPNIADFCSIVFATGQFCHNDRAACDTLSQKHFLVKTSGNVYRIYASHKCFEQKLGFFNKDQNDIKYIDIDWAILQHEGAKFIGILIFNEDEFKRQCAEHKHYWEWKKNRNEVRAALEADYGFDGKAALHLIRLITMAEDILKDHTVKVCRTGVDADFLLSIRRGALSYDEVIKLAEEKEANLKKLYVESTLQFSANKEAIDALYREIVFEFWGKGLN